jgi:hypothetical protein
MMSSADILYNQIFEAGDFVTGVRQLSKDGQSVLLSGNHPVGSAATAKAMLYSGPLYPSSSTGYAYFTPEFPGQTVTTATFYGPNTPLFNPGIGAGNVRAVGSYKYSEAGAADYSMMYEGPLDGSGTWTALIVPESVAGTAVFSTIAHSTMGNLVVGNYDLADKPGSASAFIYDIRTKTMTQLTLGPLTTAYGIWQNGGDASEHYTIVGGYKGDEGINLGFVLDYDATSKKISNMTSYSYNDLPGIVTHFEGITETKDGYSLAATTDKGAAFATITRQDDGSFSKAKWFLVAYPDSKGPTTANTVIHSNLMGIFTSDSGVQSYVATLSLD